MPESLLELAASAQPLGRAYRRYARARGLWSPGIPMWQVQRNPVPALLALADELRSGQYKPASAVNVSILRADGALRTISVYCVRDRLAQRAVLEVLQARTDASMSPASFGFRPGRSVAQALAQARCWLEGGFPWAAALDVTRCFEEIAHEPLLEKVALRTGMPDAPDVMRHMLGLRWRTR
jgi:hypothetical protein